MSEQVSRAEFNELKGQLELVCQHLGLELGDFVSQGSGRRRAEFVEDETFNGFDHEEPFSLGQENNTVSAQEEDSEEGWESINDDEDPDHTISYDREEEAEEESLPEEVKEEEEVRHLPTSLNYADFETEEDDTPMFGEADNEDEAEAEVKSEGQAAGVTPEVLTAIFDVENVLTANDIASKQFTEIKKSLFTSPYDVDAVDEFLDEYLEVLQTRDVSESKYAEALLKLDGRKFPEGSEGYKKAEVDSFVSEIAAELKRRIDVVS